jgi:hypothetical protein
VPRTLAPAPPTDRRYWRLLLRRAHPDSGGTHDLFLWTQALREHVASDELEEPTEPRSPPRRPTKEESPRVDYTEASSKAQSFEELTRVAVALADDLEEPYASVLRLLSDCHEVEEVAGVVYRHQHQGATYRSCAAVAYRANMSKADALIEANGAQREQ